MSYSKNTDPGRTSLKINNLLMQNSMLDNYYIAHHFSFRYGPNGFQIPDLPIQWSTI